MRRLALLLVMFLSANAIADSHDDERFSVSLGAFITDRSTDTQLNSAANPGTDIDFENDLGLENSDTVFRVDGQSARSRWVVRRRERPL